MVAGSNPVRISDKLNRLDSLTAPGREAQVKEETVLDTLLDLASYAIMASLWVTEPIDIVQYSEPC